MAQHQPIVTEHGHHQRGAHAGVLRVGVGGVEDGAVGVVHADVHGPTHIAHAGRGTGLFQPPTQFGADEAIVKAMQAHHGEYPYETVESIIVQTADAISGARPGARRDSVENYLKRLGDLESIATSMNGIDKAYALQAGRELRVFVTPSEVNDLEAKNIARDIAVRIEKELKYPGEIRVVVIRESRTIEFAR